MELECSLFVEFICGYIKIRWCYFSIIISFVSWVKSLGININCDSIKKSFEYVKCCFNFILFCCFVKIF